MIRDREIQGYTMAEKFSWKAMAPAWRVIRINQQPSLANTGHHWPQTSDYILSYTCVHVDYRPNQPHKTHTTAWEEQSIRTVRKIPVRTQTGLSSKSCLVFPETKLILVSPWSCWKGHQIYTQHCSYINSTESGANPRALKLTFCPQIPSLERPFPSRAPGCRAHMAVWLQAHGWNILQRRAGTQQSNAISRPAEQHHHLGSRRAPPRWQRQPPGWHWRGPAALPVPAGSATREQRLLSLLA